MYVIGSGAYLVCTGSVWRAHGGGHQVCVRCNFVCRTGPHYWHLYVCMYVFVCIYVSVPNAGNFVCRTGQHYWHLYVCVYTCMYVCMYVCMYGYSGVYMHACMHAYASINTSLIGSKDAAYSGKTLWRASSRTKICIHACVSLCTHTNIHFLYTYMVIRTSLI